MQISQTEKHRLVQSARMAGMSDAEILRKLIMGVFGKNKRKKMIIEWGRIMGYDPKSALALAHSGGLILDEKLPSGFQKPQHKAQDKSGE